MKKLTDKEKIKMFDKMLGAGDIQVIEANIGAPEEWPRPKTDKEKLKFGYEMSEDEKIGFIDQFNFMN